MESQALGVVIFLSFILGAAMDRWLVTRKRPKRKRAKTMSEMKPIARSLAPYAKPSGKRKPVVNDDLAGWAKENDLDLREG